MGFREIGVAAKKPQRLFLHVEKARPFFREGEVWFCALGVNVGFEQDGRGGSFLRPVIISRNLTMSHFGVFHLLKTRKKASIILLSD